MGAGLPPARAAADTMVRGEVWRDGAADPVTEGLEQLDVFLASLDKYRLYSEVWLSSG
jgi:hypothetical protein